MSQGHNFGGETGQRIAGWLRAIKRDPALAKRLFRTRSEIEADAEREAEQAKGMTQ